MEFRFYKYQGTGNDFVIFDGINHAYPSLNQVQIARLCDRRFGIGADGLMIILPDQDADFRMLYYNADGRESSMCGNGGRCIAHLAHANRICGANTHFIAIDGPHQAIINHDMVKLQMKSSIIPTKNELGDYIINTGSPHYVHFSDLSSLSNIVAYGRSIRYSETFAKDGINVNLVAQNTDGINVATYERGVEDETYSCGTGVTAAALAAHDLKGLSSPIQIHTKGGDLKVYFSKETSGYEDVYLEGPATLVFEGIVDLNL